MRIYNHINSGKVKSPRYTSSATTGASLSDDESPATILQAEGTPRAQTETVDTFQPVSEWTSGDDSTEFIRVRWPHSAFPLQVGIQNDSQEDAGMARFIYSVVREWEAASGGLIRFAQTDQSTQESIILRPYRIKCS